MKNVLLVHGFNGIPKIFDYFKEELEKLGYNVFLPDFPVREDITVDKRGITSLLFYNRKVQYMSKNMLFCYRFI